MEDNEIKTFYPKSRHEWRNWLEQNHISNKCAWLIYYKKKSGKPTVSYNNAVDEALCFGWIDSKAKPVDEEKFMQFSLNENLQVSGQKIIKEKFSD